MKKYLFFAILTLLQVSLTALSQTSMQHFLEKAYCCNLIASYDEEKIYFESSAIFQDGSDFVLDLGENLFAQLPLNRDANGYFLPISSSLNSIVKLCRLDAGLPVCRDCGRKYVYSCDTPSCRAKREAILQAHKDRSKQLQQQYEQKKAEEKKQKK